MLILSRSKFIRPTSGELISLDSPAILLTGSVSSGILSCDRGGEGGGDGVMFLSTTSKRRPRFFTFDVDRRDETARLLVIQERVLLFLQKTRSIQRRHHPSHDMFGGRAGDVKTNSIIQLKKRSASDFAHRRADETSTTTRRRSPTIMLTRGRTNWKKNNNASVADFGI